MTDEVNPEQNEKPVDDPIDKFDQIKTRYEEELKTKDDRIAELEAKLSNKENEVDEAIDNLNNEVNEKLKQSEELKALQANVNELLKDKANALVDKYIHEGKLVPAQRDKALSLCLSDQDMFIELYENAPSVVDMKPKAKKITGNIDNMVSYFKN